MSKHVEENIVKISFDNKDFEKNIKQSEKSVNTFTGSLGNLKDTVVQIPADIVNGLTNVLKNMNIGDIIGTGAILGGISLITSGIRGIGTTIESVASGALNMIKTVSAQAYNIIKEGGKQRALNIQQAKFMIEGLGLDVEMFMDAANYAVSDTAYGLDAAAKAAARFGATGIVTSEKLKYSLRGISGVASMAGASYEEIAEVFTDIAGLGKATYQELQRLSLRGIDPYLYLGRHLKVTREEAEQLARDGEISFDQFAKAMDEAFGEHAKEANKTFTGVTQNIEAALRKIGEGFQTPLITNTLGFLDSLRAGINDFKKELQENAVFSSFTENVQHVSDKLQNMVENLTYTLDKNLFGDSSFMTKFSDFLIFAFDKIDQVLSGMSYTYSIQLTDIVVGLGNVMDLVKLIAGSAYDALDEVFGISHMGAQFYSFVSWIGELLTSLSQIISGENGSNIAALKDVFVSWLSTIKQIVGAMKEILGISRDSVAEFFEKSVSKVVEFFKGLKVSDDEMDKLTRTARGLAAVIDIARMLIVDLVKFLSPALGLTEPLIDGILTGTASLGDWLVALRDSIKESEFFKHVFETIGGVFVWIGNVLKQIKETLVQLFSGMPSGGISSDDSIIMKIIKFVGYLIDSVSGIASDNSLKEKIGSVFDFVKYIFSGIINLFSSSNGTLAEANEELDANEKELDEFKIHLIDLIDFMWIPKLMGKLINMNLDDIANFFDKFADSFTKFASNFNHGEGLELTAENINAFADVLIVLIKSIEHAIEVIMIAVNAYLIIQTVASNANLIAGKFTGFSQLEKIRQTVDDFFRHAKGMVKSITSGTAIGPFFQSGTDTVTNVLRQIVNLILSITLALAVLSSIDSKELRKSIGTIAAFVGIIAGLIGFIYLLSGSLKSLVSSSDKANAEMKKEYGGDLSTGVLSRESKTGNFFVSCAIFIQSITLGLLEVAAAMALLNEAIDISTPEGIFKQFVVIGSLLAILGVIFAMMIKIPNDTHMSDWGDFIAMAASFVLITTGLVEIAGALMLMTTVDSFKLLAAAGTVTLLIFAIGAVITTMTKVIGSDTDNAVQMIAAAGSIAIILKILQGVIMAFAAIIVTLSGISSEDIDKVKSVLWGINWMIVIMSVVLGGLTLLGGILGESKTALIGMAIVAAALFELVFYFGEMIALVNAAANTIKSWNDLLIAFKDLIIFAKDISDEDAEGIASRLEKMVSSIPKGIIKGLFSIDKELIDGIKSYYPMILEFVTGTLIPMLNNLFVEVIPDIYQSTLEVIKSIIDMINKTPVEQFIQIGEFILSLLDMLFDFVFDGLELLLDKINENIPILEPKILTIVMNIIETFNKFISENQDSIEKEISYLVQSIVLFLAAAFLSEETIGEVWNIMADVINVMIEGLAKSAVHLGELFSKLARFAAASFFLELATFGLFDSENMFDSMFSEDDFQITPTMDLSKIQEGKARIDELMSNRTYNYDGVYASNASPWQRRQNTSFKLDGIGDTVKGIFENAKSKLNSDNTTNVLVEFVPNDYGFMKEIGRYSSAQSLAGYDDFGY